MAKPTTVEGAVLLPEGSLTPNARLRSTRFRPIWAVFSPSVRVLRTIYWYSAGWLASW
jgi:hypothetical protein